MWNLPPTDSVTFEDLLARVHPLDRERVRAAFVATRAIVGAYEIDFRIMVGAEIRWISPRASATIRPSTWVWPTASSST